MDKSQYDEEKILEYSKKLKVIGHPLRLKLLILIKEKSTCVGDLWQCLHTSQPVISQHLAVLKDAGIVISEVKGNKRIYKVVDTFIDDLIKSFKL
ncbi:MAG: hypothetical protein B6229_01460 [Spirochaetaceae bacterium 4572_7]|nr:MAG: hypothetical protein B6229_01460 [Spirochaetaceae bacterium 4572_7]